MVAYSKKARDFGALLQAQGLNPLIVLDVGRSFHVDFTPETDSCRIAAVNLGRKNLRFIEAKHATDAFGASIVSAYFGPKI